MKSLSATFRVEATSPPTFTEAPLPNSTPFGFTRNTWPFEVSRPWMFEASTPTTRFSATALAPGWMKLTCASAPMLKLCQLMLAFWLAWLMSRRLPALLRLNFGVFVLHAVQLAMWLAVPALLVQAGLPHAHHWWVYLPAVLASFLVMGTTLFPLEKRGFLRAVFLTAIGLTTAVQFGLLLVATGTPSVGVLAALLFIFFCGFNVLEASQPSMVSRVAPAHARGAAMGVYNTLQSLGFFAGGVMGGWLVKHLGAQGLFAVCAGVMLMWLLVAWPMRAPHTSAATLAAKAG